MPQTSDVKVKLGTDANGADLYIYVQAEVAAAEELVSGRVVQGLGKALDAVRAVSSEVSTIAKEIAPDKFTVEMSFEFKAESSGLVAMLVRSGGTASLTVTMEWDKASPPPAVSAGSTAAAVSAPGAPGAAPAVSG